MPPSGLQSGRYFLSYLQALVGERDSYLKTGGLAPLTNNQRYIQWRILLLNGKGCTGRVRFPGGGEGRRATHRKPLCPCPSPSLVEGRGRACRETRFIPENPRFCYTQWRILLHPVAFSVTPSGAFCYTQWRFQRGLESGGSILRPSICSSPYFSRFSRADQARRTSRRRLAVILLG